MMRTTILFLMLLPGLSIAAGSNKEHWTTGLFFGAHEPRILDIANGLQKSPIIGFGNVKEIPGDASSSKRYDFSIKSNLTPKSTGVKTGFTIAWDANQRHSMIFSIAAWENSLYASQVSELPIQSSLTPTHIARKSITSYTEYSLGWRFNFLKLKSLSFFTHASIHEIFDIDYKDNIVFTLNYDNPGDSYTRAMVLEAQTASMMLTGLALGMEYKTRENFSINVSGGYLYGKKSTSLNNLNYKEDFLSQDGLDFYGKPFGVDDKGDLFYLPASTTPENFNDTESPYKALNFSLNGWQVLVLMSLTF